MAIRAGAGILWKPYGPLLTYLDINAEPWQIEECWRLVKQHGALNSKDSTCSGCMKTSEALARLRGGKTEKKHSSTAALIVLINAEHQAVQELFGAGLVHALRCGELLLRAKGKLNHGEWIPWWKGTARFL